MDVEEARRAVYTRVQCLDSANVLKIMGYLLLQDISEKEMLELARSSDSVVEAFVARAKQELGLISSGGGSADDQALAIDSIPCLGAEGSQVLGLGSQSPVQDLSDIWERPSYLEKLTRADHVAAVNATSPSSPSWKPCLYFARGYCKHGSACRFLHVSSGDESLEKISNSSTSSGGSNASNPPPASSSSDLTGSSMVDSLAGLEAELRELLTGRRTPVSIASLPQLYHEKFGKSLQADGYLTESQRHGKAGHSLTKLLIKLRATVTLLDRPHGQHAVVLAEDAHKFMAYGQDSSAIAANPSSRQIYLTFPAESGFSEEDVTTHFSSFGPVQDVRIPYQQKRMFGFVTFTYSETVRTILAEGNPHYICGARVLVKPYKEKGRHGNEKKADPDAKPLQSRNFDRNRHQQSTALKYHLQDQAISRALGEEELAAALQRKLAEFHLANVQQRIAESYLATGASATSLVPEENLNTSQIKAEEQQDSSQVQLNPYSYVLDVLDLDPNEEQSLKCNLQSDKKMPSDTPTFFAHDIF
ncbi:zinc finger CCCH domain-containing protein 18 [Selaginella moellendorffii]|uniref:zinc finger CCCH domain-containing protein 18 n=1 Tax=Selaginella moellendorffii TaxID=88036 RepID=UPI000D1CF8DC|nr:zinc finger CCCH domain-containing protein 18 [Selaginella moellendorffii]|eukprot:XP_024515369.1 zinc finger CCCH domain-containing protein 18 [Selaginella moellendorffii]